jgi:hypothetical protein
MRVVNDLQAVLLLFAMVFHFILATVDVRAAVGVPSWAVYACIFVVDLLLVFGEV